MPDDIPHAIAHDGATLDVAIVGAGFAGLYMLHRARRTGLSAIAFEAADDVGGTWYWNRYPGARCDIESLEYSYGFDDDLQRSWRWTERYAAQPEILAYARHVADRYDLRRDIRFETRVSGARWDDARRSWTVTAERGAPVRARFLVLASGPLSRTHLPGFDGVGSFAGRTFHTGRWPHEPVSFAGRRVAVIGTGSSAVQLVPEVAREAGRLTVFQRTAAYVVPARNGPIDAAHEARVRADYPAFRARNRQMATAFGSLLPVGADAALDVDDAERQRVFSHRWAHGGFAFGRSFRDLALDERANEHAAAFVRERIAEIVVDPVVARRLMPRQPMMCKRLCVGDGYYPAFNRPNVRLVDLAESPIERVVEQGIVAGGETMPFDDIVFATGFDAMTGSLLAIDPVGRDGVPLSAVWRDGPVNLLGLAVAGFPNLFTPVGPGSPSAFTNVIVQIEQHVDWIAACIGWLRSRGHASIEASPDAQAAWVAHVNAQAAPTVFSRCDSWYVGANVPGKPRMMMALLGFPAYVERCDEVARGGYTGFLVN